MKRHLPNFLTCLNLFSGCIGVTLALNGQLIPAAYCVVVSGIFDFLDGFVARALGVKSAIGKELDSLADVISFGFVPGAVLFRLLGDAWPDEAYIRYLGFAVTVFSALRLAKFNLDPRQTADFIGLNTPMNAFYVVSLPFVSDRFGIAFSGVFLLVSIVLACLLMVSEIRLFSLKSDGRAWWENRWKFIFIILSAVSVALFNFAAVPLVLVMYFLFSYIHFKFR